MDEFAKLVGHLTDRISGVGEDGKPKVFRDSAVGNLGDFFERFSSLNVRSNDQLDALVAQAQQAVRGVGARDLRGSGDLRQRVANELSQRPVGPGRAHGRSAPQEDHPAHHHDGDIMNLVIEKGGRVRGIYSEVIDLAALGPSVITRASHVEPDSQGRWLADLSPVGGPVLGPFEQRSEALEAEVAWLEANWLEGDLSGRED